MHFLKSRFKLLVTQKKGKSLTARNVRVNKARAIGVWADTVVFGKMRARVVGVWWFTGPGTCSKGLGFNTHTGTEVRF